MARTLELVVGPVAHGGVFVARHEGRVVFTSDALPGERVRAQVVDDRHDRYWRAETVEVLEASADRRDHVWDAASIARDPAERAGGAEFGHIRLARQRELKADVLREAFERFAGLEQAPEVEAVAPGADAPTGASDDGTAWRTRVRLQVALGTDDVTVLADAGHYAPAERPDAFARAMLDWHT